MAGPSAIRGLGSALRSARRAGRNGHGQKHPLRVGWDGAKARGLEFWWGGRLGGLVREAGGLTRSSGPVQGEERPRGLQWGAVGRCV